MMRWETSFPSYTSIGKNHEVIAKNIIKYKFATFMLLASGVILSEEKSCELCEEYFMNGEGKHRLY